MQNIKVLHILHEIDFSGAEIMLNHSAGYFQNKGFELYALNSDVVLGNYAHIMAQSGFQIIHLPTNGFFSHFRRFSQLLKENKFDIVHNHTEKYFFWYALISRIHRSRFIYTIHSSFILNWPARIKRAVYRFVAKVFFDVKYVTISRSVQENETRQFLNASILIPNWINAEIFHPLVDIKEKILLRQLLNIPEDKFVIISVGSCISIKNHIEIIKAMPFIINKYNNILYINIGDGPLKNELENLAQKTGLNEYVCFLGQKKNVRDYLVASDVFVMPSKNEGLGNALLEALSCELPAIVHNVSGLRDLVIDGKNGFIVEEDHEKVAEKIILLYENPNLAKQMGKEAGNFVRENYDMNASLKKMLALYQSSSKQNNVTSQFKKD